MIYKKFKEIFKNVKQQNPLLMGRVDYLVEHSLSQYRLYEIFLNFFLIIVGNSQVKYTGVSTCNS